MAVKQTTLGPTEGDLEAEIHAVLKVAFPWLPSGSIQHQTTFSFSFGGKVVEIDGAKRESATARADILLHYNHRPLAILELKRPGTPLDADDDAQGLSYARVLHPQPPLVVVTNGADIRMLETHSGAEWTLSERSSEALAGLIKAAAFVATQDLKAAVSTLMGSNPQVWVQAVRRVSDQSISELSGVWHDPLRPFVPDFLIPRQATQDILDHLGQDRRLILVEGPPLVGKSNVLRELVRETAKADEFVVLFIEADVGSGILQQLADTLSASLSWPVTGGEVRHWLMRLSRNNGPALVIAIDGIGLRHDEFRRDIEDLTSQVFGPAVRFVVAMDDTIAERLVVNSTGRKATPIGRRSVRVPVGPLDDREFRHALRVLDDHRAGIMTGGQSAPELRLPWILRAVMSEIVSRPQYANQNLAASMPPLLGLDLIAHARRQFTNDELRRQFRAVAEAVIADSSNRRRPISLILESLAVYVVRRASLRQLLDASEIAQMIEQGYLRPIMHESGTPILVVRIPELAASEAADLFAIELAERARVDAEKAANWLSGEAANLPLGDVVAAQALYDAAMRHGLPFNLITALINSPPQQQTVKPGTKAAIHMPGAGPLNMVFREHGVIEIQTGGRRELIEPEPDEREHITYSDFHSWLILSHLAGVPFAIESEEGQLGRVDPAILLEVGTCSIVLQRPGADSHRNGVLTHDLPGHGSMVCHKAGIVEPITYSILRFLGSEWERAEEWIEEAVQRDSLPLLMRIDIALRQLSGSADVDKARFARHALDDMIRPAMSQFPHLH